MKKYDLIILGGGAAAFAAANTANKLKKNTLVINDKKILPLGGTCVNVGCVPSKILLYQGAQYYYPSHSKFRGVKLKGKANLLDAIKETKEMVLGFRSKNYSNVIKKQKFVDFKEGFASFVNSHTVQVGKEKFEGKFILIATGAQTFIPEIPGLDKTNYLTNVNLFDLKKVPKSIIILGGGPLGMEFAQIFHHFGVKVTVLQKGEYLIPRFDSMLGAELKKQFTQEGIKIHTLADTKKIKKTKNGVSLTANINGNIKKIFANKIMLATGLTPNLKKINAEKIGVKLNKRGFVKVNKFLKTSLNNIYAVGDVNGVMPLETVAAKQGHFAVLNMFEDAKKTINYNEIPSAVFTSPEVAAVGISEDAYMQKYKTCLCRTVTLDHVEKAGAIKDTRGLIRMVLHHKSLRVVGVHIIGVGAADIITTATYAIKNKMTIDDIRDTVHVFPTMSEMIKKVAQSFTQNLDEMACCVE